MSLCCCLLGKFQTKEDVEKASEHDGRKGVTAKEKDWKIIEALNDVAKELDVKPGQASLRLTLD